MAIFKKADPAREELRAVVKRENEKRERLASARQGAKRAEQAVLETDRDVRQARQALTEVRQVHAATLARAYSTGSEPASLAGEDRAARQALEDAENRHNAAKAALTTLKTIEEETERELLYSGLRSAIRGVAAVKEAELYAEAITLQKRLTRIKAVMQMMVGRGFFGNAETRQLLTLNQILPLFGDIGAPFRDGLDIDDWHEAVKRMETDPDAEFPA